MTYNISSDELYERVREIDPNAAEYIIKFLVKEGIHWKGSIDTLFLWDTTEQGSIFWYDIHTTIEENIKKEKANKRYNDPGII